MSDASVNQNKEDHSDAIIIGNTIFDPAPNGNTDNTQQDTQKGDEKIGPAIWDIQLGLWANGLNNPDRINIGALCRPGSVIIREFIDINTTKGVCSRQMDVLMGHIMHYLSAATKLARDEATLLGPSNYLCHFVFFLFIAIDKNRLLLQNLLDRGLWITNWEHIRLHIRCYRVLILHVSQFTTPFNGVEMLDGLTSEGPHHNFEGLHRGTDRMFRNLENRLGFGPIDDCETSGELSIWPL